MLMEKRRVVGQWGKAFLQDWDSGQGATPWSSQVDRKSNLLIAFGIWNPKILGNLWVITQSDFCLGVGLIINIQGFWQYSNMGEFTHTLTYTGIPL